MKKSFEVSIGLVNIGVFDNFVDAFKLFWNKVMQTMEKGAALQVLEMTNFITMINENRKFPLGFYDVRNLAYDIGLLVQPDGEGSRPIVLDQPTAEGWEAMVEARYAAVPGDIVSGMLGGLIKDLRTIERMTGEMLDFVSHSGEGSA